MLSKRTREDTGGEVVIVHRARSLSCGSWHFSDSDGWWFTVM